MRHNAFDSRVLRGLAEEIIHKIAQERAIPENEREDFVTSLVRQWISYEGTASLFFDAVQSYFVVSKTPLGRFYIVTQAGHSGWTKPMIEDWKINPEELPDILDQLNLSQSAEVTNMDGLPLRVWVNPKERSSGIEPLVKQPPPPGHKRDNRKIAVNQLQQAFGSILMEDELEALVGSMLKQWQIHDGNACLFLDGGQVIIFKLAEMGNGECNVRVTRQPTNLEPWLASLGLHPNIISDVIVRLNLGQDVEFRDRNGIPSTLTPNPKVGQVTARTIQIQPSAAPQDQPSETPPICCPKCGTLLQLWDSLERQQTCPQCGDVISSL